jgi:hypothetical protein
VIVIAPDAVAPPATLDGEIVKDASDGGRTVSIAVFGAKAPMRAEICAEGASPTTLGLPATGYVCTMKFAEIEPG